MFKVNEQNLIDARAAVEQFGECWLHGCGNIYPTKEASQFRDKWSNPLHNGQASAPKYWAHFTSVDQIPKTVEELHKLFEANKSKQYRETAEKENKNTPTVKILKPTAKTVKATADDDEKVTATDLIRTASVLQEKQSDLLQREDSLDKKEIEIAEKQQEIYAKEQEIQAIARQKDKELSDRHEALKAKEAELTKLAAELKKAGGKPAANS